MSAQFSPNLKSCILHAFDAMRQDSIRAFALGRISVQIRPASNDPHVTHSNHQSVWHLFWCWFSPFMGARFRVSLCHLNDQWDFHADSVGFHSHLKRMWLASRQRVPLRSVSRSHHFLYCLFSRAYGVPNWLCLFSFCMHFAWWVGQIRSSVSIICAFIIVDRILTVTGQARTAIAEWKFTNHITKLWWH